MDRTFGKNISGDVFSVSYKIIDYYTNGDRTRYIDSQIDVYLGSLKMMGAGFRDPNAEYNWEKTWGAHFEAIRNRDRVADWVPILGAIESMDQAIDKGRYGAAALYFGLALSDLAFVKTAVIGGGKILLKGGLKLTGSHTFSATKSFWSKKGITELMGGSKHHWLLSQSLMKNIQLFCP
ncbi:MAG: hypothetical protein HWD62_02725 [Cyclobacteriaceae bacterium]|nr:MAG: hypothetical protein HWD62_02725 [Cyclobacteriaceae bacterium]